jgi:hypothetical protein
MTSRPIFTVLTAASFAACSPGPGSAIPQSGIERQMLGLMQKFDRWDYDGDGELNAREIDTGIRTLKGSSRAVTYTADEVIAHYDQNGNKTISLREAQAGYRQRTDQRDNPPAER